MTTTTGQDQPPPAQQPAQHPRKGSIRKSSDSASDRTWLETILKEKKAMNDWDRKWGMILELLKERDEKLANLPRSRHRMNKEKEFKAKVSIDVQPSPPIPTTSSAVVGWRCTSDFWLENFGPLYVSPRLTIEPPTDPSLDLEDFGHRREGDDPLDRKLDKRRSGLYTTSVILLK